MKHRPDIDGLRAVAVIPVVLFHLGVGCPGGYVGVDVFFVISGYLITSLILRALAEDRFSLVEFWERRIRRIVPALVTLVVATLIAGWFLLLPEDYELLGRAAIAQTLMAANFYFFKSGDYFAPAVETNPLLHTWSLAVEEQFYLVLPLLLARLWKRARHRLVLTLAILGAASLSASLFGVSWFPKSTFYLLSTRAWELLLGSLLAAAPACSLNRRTCELLSAGGLIAILVTVFAYHREIPFPGAAALPPCLGALAVLWANSSTRTWTGRCLSWTPVAFVGWISYSLYLWHWPIIVYAKYWSHDELTASQCGGILIAAFGLATLSWRFIEQPFRVAGPSASPWRVFAPAWTSFAVLLLMSSAIAIGNGLPFRLPPHVVALSKARHERGEIREVSLKEARSGKFLEIGIDDSAAPVDVFLCGDSHAMAVIPAVRELCLQQGFRGLAATRSGMPPLLDLKGLFSHKRLGDVAEYNRSVLDFVVQRRIPRVILVGRWTYYQSHWTERQWDGPGLLRDRLRSTIKALSDAGVEVYLMKEVPCYKTSVPQALAKIALRGESQDVLQMPASRHRKYVAVVDDILKELQDCDVTLLDPVPWFVDDRGLCQVERDGRPLYYDDDHLSVPGALQLRPMFQSVLTRQTVHLEFNTEIQRR